MSVQIDGSTGNIIATKADYSGDVSIGGTLTYEDVTNVDSVGIITARSGVNVTGGSVGIGTDSPVSGVKLHLQDTSACRLQLSTNNTGHTSSDGVRLMIDGSNNFEILQREEANIEFFTNNTERARITSSGNFGIGETSPTRRLVITGDTNTVAVVRGATNGTSSLFLGDSDDEDIGALTYNHPSNYLAITVNASERARIDSAGRLLLGTTTEGYSSGDDLTIATSGHTGITLRSGTTSEGAVYFSDATSGGGEYIGSLVYSHNTNNMIFTANGAERMRIDSSGHLLHGVTADEDTSGNGGVRFINAGDIQIDGDQQALVFRSTNNTAQEQSAIEWWNENGAGIQAKILCDRTAVSQAPGDLVFYTSANVDSGGSGSDGDITERLRITSAGKIQITGTRGGSLQASDNDSLELYTSASNGAVNTGSGLTFYNNDGNGYEIGGTIQVAKENGSINNTAGYLRFCTRPNASDVAERMRIDSSGKIYFQKTTTSFNTEGALISQSDGNTHFTTLGGQACSFNRGTNDGKIISLLQDANEEGNISVSGSTVSYNGAHLSRWSQLAGGAERTEILRGSVLSNLDEMCEWGEEDNEQLNRMKVSDVEGDRNVAGVFQDWDDDDDTYTNDFYCAMTGDFVIRIAQGTTVARGDLLMSAGDGTAKPQDDDIIRSKTIAKVTSTTVSTTYSDGSYCVPCVLMAC